MYPMHCSFAFLLYPEIVTRQQPYVVCDHSLVHATDTGRCSRRLASDMPGGVIPDQQPGGLALGLQPCATPLQKLGDQSTHRTTRDEAKQHLATNGIALRSQ